MRILIIEDDASGGSAITLDHIVQGNKVRVSYETTADIVPENP